MSLKKKPNVQENAGVIYCPGMTQCLFPFYMVLPVSFFFSCGTNVEALRALVVCGPACMRSVCICITWFLFYDIFKWPILCSVDGVWVL